MRTLRKKLHLSQYQKFNFKSRFFRHFQWYLPKFSSNFPATKYSILIKLSEFLYSLAFLLTAEQRLLGPSLNAVVILPELQ